ncbi:glycosyltransferase family 4 protein [Parasphingorhabdus sp.]|uniref:glycosyltransferase family 4 protein n=1 Tax=Parasphingorhabdus sp. TaxID=2709688 RepID=UPI003A94FFDD
MKILILSFYFPPDLSAGSFRTSALVDALKRLGHEQLEIDVITTQPNRYSQIADTVDAIEDHGWLRIKRIELPAHNSGMRDQSVAFAKFAKKVLDLTKGNNWDMVYATSSRLMTAALGAHVARRLKLPLYLDIRDLFLDTMNDVLSGSHARHLLPVFKWLEKKTFQKATRMSIVSEGFLDHLCGITSSSKFSVFTNGIDEIFLTSDFRKTTKSTDPTSLPCILYAGNIGEGQGLHHILPQAAVALQDIARFRVVGGGGRAPLLHSMLDQTGLPDGVVETSSPVPRAELLEEYRQADILFLHLNDYDAFRKVLPSKIFEYAATGKPVVAGVAGHAADFLKQHVPHAEVFDPCDVNGMIAAVKKAVKAPAHVDRSDFCHAYARSAIMDRMAKEMLTLISSSKSGT